MPLTLKSRGAVLSLLSALLLAGCGPEIVKPKILGRQVRHWDTGWRFKGGDPNRAASPDVNDADWQIVNLPHDWMILQTPDPNAPSGPAGGFYPGGVGWYRKRLALDRDEDHRKVTLYIDGALPQCDVFVNGQHVGAGHYGYLSYHFDISRFLHLGTDNLIAIRVDGSVQPVSRWYSGCGLYRHVRLSLYEPLYIEDAGVVVTTPWITPEQAQVKLNTTVRNDTRDILPYRLETVLKTPDGQTVATLSSDSSLPRTSQEDIEQQTMIDKPGLWDTQHPQLYRAISTLTLNKLVVDRVETTFGLRKPEFKADSGFWLNDRPLKLKGVCLHHDGGVLGAAVPRRVWQRRLEILKSMGVNAVRLAHNPPAPEVLDLCDRLGLLVIDELFDKWRSPWQGSKPWAAPQLAAYQTDFDHHWAQDINDFIQRDRNHPSVILWSVGNETLEQLKDPNQAVAELDHFVGRVHELDPTREVTCALHPHGEFPSRLIHHMDVVAYNYQTAALPRLHRLYPSYRWLASETKAVQNDVPADWNDVDFSRNSWFALTDSIAGQFIWSGIDYLGESPGWPSKGFPGGLLETNGFKKPVAYFTQSLYSDRPMVHVTVLDANLAHARAAHPSWQDSWYGPPVTDHWTFPGKVGQTLPVYVFTNCPVVTLTLNGQSLGHRRLADSPDHVLRWQVPYRPGTLRAVGTDQAGKVIAEHRLVTAGPSARIKLKADRSDLQADGRDVAHIEIQIVDEHGVRVPSSQAAVRVHLQGPGRFLGLDNGDLTDLTPTTSTRSTARQGRLLLMIQSQTTPGTIEVNVTSDSLPSASITIKTQSKS